MVNQTNTKSLFQISLILIAFSCASSTFAQSIEIVEAEPDFIGESSEETSSESSSWQRYPTARSLDAQSPSASAKSNNGFPLNESSDTALSNAGGIFAKIQRLEVEVSELRGLVEEQAFLIEKLNQQRMDDYLEFDRRIGELRETRLNSGAVDSTTQGARSVENGSEPVPATNVIEESPKQLVGHPTSASSAGREAYRKAYGRIKQRNFAAAKTELEAFLKAYPSSEYVPNAHFWLGELYFVEENNNQAANHFSSLCNDFPQHKKAVDGRFKLAKSQFKMGDRRSAKSNLEKIISEHQTSRIAAAAKDYLEANF